MNFVRLFVNFLPMILWKRFLFPFSLAYSSSVASIEGQNLFFDFVCFRKGRGVKTSSLKIQLLHFYSDFFGPSGVYSRLVG